LGLLYSIPTFTLTLSFHFLMPIWIFIYLIIFLMMLTLNIIYLFRSRSKIIIVIYDIIEGLFLAFMISAYWITPLAQHLAVWIIPAYLFMISIDIYISVWADVRKLGIKIPEEMSDREIESANLVSLLFTSPAYFIAGLVCLEFISKKYQHYL
jgi:hypothetical protein